MAELELLVRPAIIQGPVRWLLFQQGKLLMRTDGQPPGWLEDKIHHFCCAEQLEEHYLGRLGELHCIAVDLPAHADVPEYLAAFELRQLLMLLDEPLFALVSRASQLVNWYRNHRFCSRCGVATERHGRDFAMLCPACGYGQYPRITPCVIMLVRRDERVLLARSTRFQLPMFSCLAGFMEAGESAEQAVRREVLEETGLKIRNLRYHDSQSWPFPHSLMLAFHADYAGGKIRLDDEEIAEADWFNADQLPLIPPQGSIARSLIDAWLADVQPNVGREA